MVLILNNYFQSQKCQNITDPVNFAQTTISIILTLSSSTTTYVRYTMLLSACGHMLELWGQYLGSSFNNVFSDCFLRLLPGSVPTYNPLVYTAELDHCYSEGQNVKESNSSLSYWFCITILVPNEVRVLALFASGRMYWPLLILIWFLHSPYQPTINSSIQQNWITVIQRLKIKCSTECRKLGLDHLSVF